VLRSGWLQKAVATVSAEKDDAINKRRSALVGTNLFPNLKEKPYAAKTVDLHALAASRAAEIAARRPASVGVKADGPWDEKFASAIEAASTGASVGQLQKFITSAALEGAVTPVKAHRAAEGFEALRAAVDAFAKKTGARPKVFVAKMGPVLQHKARADFSAGFFGVGGFELITKQTFETAEAAATAAIASGALITVLCSTDDTYPVLAPAFAKAVKAAKPSVNVVLAGYPTEHIEAFKAAGFDDFIHIRANVRELLSALLNKIGASA
jgi:methylmalonyl-CoA mutase